jgi:hypothetical protein
MKGSHVLTEHKLRVPVTKMSICLSLSCADLFAESTSFHMFKPIIQDKERRWIRSVLLC